VSCCIKKPAANDVLTEVAKTNENSVVLKNTIDGCIGLLSLKYSKAHATALGTIILMV
jgi:hypothetical protein